MLPSLRSAPTAAVLVLALLGSTACGASDDESPAAAQGTTAAESPTVTPEAPAENNRAELRKTLLEQLETGTESDGANETIVDCVIEGMDPAISDEVAIRVANEGPSEGNAAESTFSDVLLACLGS